MPRTGVLTMMIDSLRPFWRRAAPSERAGYVVGFLLLVSGLIHLGILIFSGSSWDGPLSFRKAATFGLSFGLTLITIAWVVSFLELRPRTRTILLTMFTTACALETALITLQVWRGVPSHFNIETTFDATITRVLAAGGAALVVAIVVFTITAFRTNPKLPISLRLAIRAGFVSLLAAQVTGALMIARGMILVFRGEPQEAYANGGILKPTHAVTMHGVLLLPALAWMLSFTNFSERHRVQVVRLATCGYVLIVAIVGIANLRSLSLGELPAAMPPLFAVGGMSILTAVGITLLGIASRHSRYDAERRSKPPSLGTASEQT